MIHRTRVLRPEFATARPSQLLKAAIRSACGFRVAPRALFPGQLALCDFQEKIVYYNTTMEDLIGSDTSWERLVTSTLAHELGHIRLHAEEITNRYTESYHLPGGGVTHTDGRNFQREQEADLYAAIFLIPGRILVKEHSARKLYKWHKEGSFKKPESIWRLVKDLAITFGVTPTLMKRCLCELGWISSGRFKNGGWKLEVRPFGSDSKDEEDW